MHFEWLVIELHPTRVSEARVGDSTFTGATIDWASLTRPDRAWIFEQLERALTCWVGPLDALHALRLSGDRHDARLEVCEADGAWAPRPSLAALEPKTRAEVQAALDEALESVYALLIIL